MTLDVATANSDVPTRLDRLACPYCRGPMTSRPGCITCPSCSADFPSRDGIIDFVREAYYWGEVPEGLMTAYVEAARAKGWRRVVSEDMAGDRDLQKNVAGVARANWRLALPVGKQSAAVDLGSGWGQNAFLMAETFDEVWSMEMVDLRARWQQIRRDQEGLNHLTVVKGNINAIPFASESFDVAVMNGLLEWVGLANETISPRQVQLEVLRDVRRTLRPGGCLYVGIENRIAMTMFLGAIDHSGLPFTSLLPRPLASLAVRAFKRDAYRTTRSKQSYRTYTYTRWGYRRLFREAGFSESDFYWVLPGYNQPHHFGSLDDSRTIQMFLQSLAPSTFRRRCARWGLLAMSRAGLFGVFSPCFLIVCRK